VKIHYEVFGTGDPTILLLPTWMIVHARAWKLQVAGLSRRFRVVTFDPPGNGRSDRPTDAGAYADGRLTEYALDVLDAVGVERAVVVGLSAGARQALVLAGDHPERVLGAVFLGPALPFAPPNPERAGIAGSFRSPAPDLPPSGVPELGDDPDEHWAKYNLAYWRSHYEDFLWFFFGRAFSEPHSTKQIEDAVGWGLETAPEYLAVDAAADALDPDTVRALASRVACPVLAIHGTKDRVVSFEQSEVLTGLTGGELVALQGAGHLPHARDPVAVNGLIRSFAERVGGVPPRRRTWTRGRVRGKRVLYLSSPIGLGHAQRDVAIARELRTLHPDVQIDWLAQHPVTRVLEAAGETVHPASAQMASESAHIESESGEHDLHCFQAWRRMDEILLADFAVFQDVVAAADYDLVIGDEAWEVDHFLHENPELKRFAYAWFTDFVGWLPMPDGGRREALVAADYNAEMIAHIERYPRLRDRALFVGDPDDIVPDAFGPDLPGIREWTEQHYDFPGYVTGFDPSAYRDREQVRSELGYDPEEKVCIVTVGGSGVGSDLLARVVAAYPQAKAADHALRMIVVAGPRIDPSSLATHDGLEVRPFVPELYRHLAVCDLAVVQGGLTTCMELTATNRPFIYVPLRHHFEQHFHVPHRLQRYGAGRRLDYHDATPDGLAEVIGQELGRTVSYRPVAADGAAAAGRLLAEML
jgi:pimeloyl-ACP methyl ester carboxylesterase